MTRKQQTPPFACAACLQYEHDTSKLFELTGKAAEKISHRFMHIPGACRVVDRAIIRERQRGEPKANSPKSWVYHELMLAIDSGTTVNAATSAESVPPEPTKPKPVEDKYARRFVQIKPPAEVNGWVITSAENMRSVHKSGLANLKAYCAAFGFQLLVFGIRTSRHPDDQWWVEDIRHHMVAESEVQLTDTVKVFNPEALRPTNQTPLQHAKIGVNEYGIVPFPKLRLCTTPYLDRNNMAGVQLTTGSITAPLPQPKTLSAQRALRQHHYGATVVDNRDETKVRPLSIASDGSIQDVINGGVCVIGGEVLFEPVVEAVYGPDLHAETASSAFIDSLVHLLHETETPQLIIGDLFNWEIGSHHNTLETEYKLRLQGVAKPLEMLKNVADLLNDIVERAALDEILIVDSNHHAHMTKWIENFYSKPIPDLMGQHAFLANLLFNVAAVTQENILELALVECGLTSDFCRFLDTNDQLEIGGTLISLHGHKGINGRPVDPKAFAEAGIPVVVGHRHSSAIYDTSFVVGCSGDQRYASGPSTWTQALCALLSNGTKTLLHPTKYGDYI